MSDGISRINIGEKEFDDKRLVIEFNTMSNDMKEIILNVTKKALQTVPDSHISYYKKLSKRMKLDLETTENKQIWNVVVGSEYGAFIAFEKANLIYFRFNEIYFLVFRFGAEEVR
jgi:hypothetical protein